MKLGELAWEGKERLQELDGHGGVREVSCLEAQWTKIIRVYLFQKGGKYLERRSMYRAWFN